MQQIDFYILKTNDFFSFACRLLEKTYKEKHRAYVCAQSQSDAQKLDNMLWSFNDISFIPHHLASDPEHSETPITIGYDDLPTNEKDILVCLSPGLPGNHKQFDRVMCVVPNDENWKAEARKLYKDFSGDEKLTVNLHKI